MVMDVKKLMGRVDCLQQYHWNMGYEAAMKPTKGDEGNVFNNFPNPQTAFLGPQLWEKKISMSNVDQEFKYWQGYRGWNEAPSSCQNGGQYHQQQQQPQLAQQQSMDQGFESTAQLLQEWTCNQPKQEQQANSMEGSPLSSSGHHYTHSNSSNPSPTCNMTPNLTRIEEKNDDVDFKVSEDDLALAIVPGAEFDPKTRSFSAEELKPQPIIKKRPKNFTPNNEKDDKYWEKRAKNNFAARRSREARRLKENQIALRAAYLEKQNMHLKITLKKLNIENAHIRVNVDHLLARIVEKQKSLENQQKNHNNNTNTLNNHTSNNNSQKLEQMVN